MRLSLATEFCSNFFTNHYRMLLTGTTAIDRVRSMPPRKSRRFWAWREAVMSHLLRSSLDAVRTMEDRRLSEARPAMATYTPASRADKIISEGEHTRLVYRAKHPLADWGMISGAQVGFLHGQVRLLADECDRLIFRHDAKLLYVDVAVAGIDADCTVGCTYSPGYPAQPFGPPEDCCEGVPEELELCEVWVNGVNLASVLSEKALDDIVAAALESIQATMAADDGEPA